MRTCIDDHVSAFINNNTTKSAFAAHLIDENHTGDEEKVLHVEFGNKKRLASENIEICCHEISYASNYNLVNKIVIKDLFIEKVFSYSPHYKEIICCIARKLTSICTVLVPMMKSFIIVLIFTHVLTGLSCLSSH